MYLLFYDYVEDIIERRVAYREAHLALVREYAARGDILLAGAMADPVDGAVIVFQVTAQQTIEEFVARDPYVANGLVTHWRIRTWTVVVDSALR